MSRVRDRSIRVLCLVAMGCALPSCSSSEPTTREMQQAIEESRHGLSVRNLECESFASRIEEGSGRTSCVGEIGTEDALYTRALQHDLAQSFVSLGMSMSDAVYHSDRFPTTYRKFAEAGTFYPLRSECDYTKQVDRWDIRCNSRHRPLPGATLAELSAENPLIMDSEQYRTVVTTIMESRGPASAN